MGHVGRIPRQLEQLGDRAIEAAFARFDDHDSGCSSYGIDLGGVRHFVKFSTTPVAHASLENALRFHQAVSHPAIVRPIGASVGDVVTLVYPWVHGDVLNQATVHGSNRQTLTRFRELSRVAIEEAVATVLDAHSAIASAGFVSVDFYDGAMLYDFDAHRMQLIDLDEYRPSPSKVVGARLPGSLSFMAPEERVRGAVIDEQTMVFTMGRTIQHLFQMNNGESRLSTTQGDVVDRATAPGRADRYCTVTELSNAWTKNSSAR